MFDGDIAGLLEWEDFGAAPMLGCARLLAEPRFQKAARALARNMLDICVDAGLRGIFKDAGRYLVAMWALYLHGEEGGLTLPGLKHLASQSGFLSPGRARSLLIYLRHLGYVEPVAGEDRQGAVRYVPTDAFRAAWTRHLTAAMAAAAIVEPGVRRLLGALDEAAISEQVNRTQSEGLLAASGADGTDWPYVRIFMDRHAGSQIAWLLLVGEADGEEFPSAAGVRLSVAAIARRFEVSRAHVRRLLADARAEGLIVEDERGLTRFSEPNHDFIRYLYAVQLVQLLASAAAVLHGRSPSAAGQRDQKCPVVTMGAEPRLTP